jgi:HemY protein
MRIFLWLLTLLAAAIGLAVLARYNLGNVVFFYPPYRVDLSLNLFIVITVATFWLLMVVLNALDFARQMPQRVAAYRKEKREREGIQALRESLKALFEGRFGHAEKAAIRASESPSNTGLAALIAARAAQKMQQSDRRDMWLGKIEGDQPMKVARLMTALELQVDDHQNEAAVETVNELSANGTRHIHALRLSLKANQQARNWPEVLRLIRTLDKRSALHPALSSRLREIAYQDLLDDSTHDAESIRLLWAKIPQEDRVKPFVASHAAPAFFKRGLQDEARSILEKALAAEWDDRLIRAYRNCAATEGTPTLLAQIERCESWMQTHPHDAELALTLGVLCFRQKLWGKAQTHLQQALSDAIQADVVRESHLSLAQLHEALGQAEQAATHYRKCALATRL